MVGFTTTPDEIQEAQPFKGAPAAADILGSGLTSKKLTQKPRRSHRSSTTSKPDVQPLDTSGKEHTLWRQHADPQLALQSREAAERVLKVTHEESGQKRP